MKILASRIAKELKKVEHYALYEPDLSRVWPDDGRQREPQIASFAKTHGWRLATTKTDSAQFSIKTRLTKETSSSVQKRRQLLPPHAQRIVFRRGDAHQQSRSNRSIPRSSQGSAVP